ncbi:MAG TPA: hypothetical protein VGO27_21625 [Candidatus Acidoferrum sp.]|nr:hypothetical protein [Candidatus Acidoferrum sp.]
MNRHYRFLFSLLIPLSASAEKSEAVWKGPDKPVYVLTQNHYAVGFTPGGATPRFEDLIAIEIIGGETPLTGEPSYKVGAHLSLFVAGERHGDVTIKKVMPLQCDSSATVVTADSSVHLGKGTMALATNAENVRSHGNNQRQPTETELDHAKLLAMNEFLKQGVPGKFSKDLEAEHLVVARVDETEHELLVGSFFLEAEGARHEIFLLVRLASSGATTELARYHKTADIEDGKDSEEVRFVDQLDLDGDGMDEIVVEVTWYEGEAFVVYKRTSGSWTQVHVGGQGGC